MVFFVHFLKGSKKADFQSLALEQIGQQQSLSSFSPPHTMAITVILERKLFWRVNKPLLVHVEKIIGVFPDKQATKGGIMPSLTDVIIKKNRKGEKIAQNTHREKKKVLRRGRVVTAAKWDRSEL